MITVDTIMATNPCADWPRAKVERMAAHLDATSWSTLVASAAASKWRLVPLADLRLTLCRHAAANHRPVLVAWMQHVTRVRVAGQRRRYPRARAEVVALWDRLDAWDGTAAQAQAIRSDAWRVYDDAAVAAAAAAVADADAAADAADAADAYAYAAADAAAADAAADAAAAAAYAYGSGDAAADAAYAYGSGAYGSGADGSGASRDLLADLAARLDAVEAS